MLDNKLHAQAAIVFLWINVWCSAAWLGYNVAGYQVVKNFASALVVMLMRSVMALGAMITFLLWFYRVYKNLDLAGVNTLYAAGWAIGSFFVPVINFIRPYRIMEEIWQENAGLVKASNPDGAQTEEQSGALLKWWWECWSLSWLSLLPAGNKISLLNPAAVMLPSREVFVWFNSFFTLLAALFAIRVIKTVAAFERIVFEKHRLQKAG
jgi:hypothetical protein